MHKGEQHVRVQSTESKNKEEAKTKKKMDILWDLILKTRRIYDYPLTMRIEQGLPHGSRVVFDIDPLPGNSDVLVVSTEVTLSDHFLTQNFVGYQGGTRSYAERLAEVYPVELDVR